MTRRCATLGLCLLLLSCNPTSTRNGSATIALECFDDRVEIRLENVPSFARSYFESQDTTFSIHTESQGGDVSFDRTVRAGPGDGEGFIEWRGDLEWKASGVQRSGGECIALGGEMFLWADCWPTCCDRFVGGTLERTVVSPARCRAAGGTMRNDIPPEECFGRVDCCLLNGRIVPVAGRGNFDDDAVTNCLAHGGQSTDSCVCCSAPNQSVAEIAGDCDDDPEISNCCFGSRGGSKTAVSSCSAQLLDVFECGPPMHNRCPEVCCALPSGEHRITTQLGCTGTIVTGDTCQFAAVCCAFADGRAHSISGHVTGTLTGTARFTPTADGNVRFSLRQRFGSVILFKEKSPGRSQCTRDVRASGGPCAKVTPGDGSFTADCAQDSHCRTGHCCTSVNSDEPGCRDPGNLCSCRRSVCGGEGSGVCGPISNPMPAPGITCCQVDADCPNACDMNTCACR